MSKPDSFSSFGQIAIPRTRKNGHVASSLNTAGKKTIANTDVNSKTNLGIDISSLSPDSTKHLDLSLHRIQSLPPGTFSKLRNLKRLKLRSNYLKSLKNGVFDGVPRLHRLDVSCNRLKEIDIGVLSCLHKLRELRLDCNVLTKVPGPLFGALSQLVRLNLSDNRIAELEADTFKATRKLEVIDLRRNYLRDLPDNLFDGVPELRILCLDMNTICELDGEIFGNLPKLTNLSLSNNRLERLEPMIFDELTSLRYLDVSRNLIERIDRSVIRSCRELEELNLNDNLISEIPDTVFDLLPKCVRMNLANNRIGVVSERGFWGCESLRMISLQGNDLTTLPARVFSYCTKLFWVRLSFNQITWLPDKLFDRNPNIRYLSLQRNHLSYLNASMFASMRNLEMLILAENGLQGLPSGLTRGMHNLKTLRLERNQIQSLHEGLFETNTELRHLSLDNNLIRDLGGSLFRGLHRLRSLSLAENLIERIPPFAFDDLLNLEHLSLFDNKLTRISPRAFRFLTKLEYLSLHENQIEKLPLFAFDPLIALTHLHLSKNKIKVLQQATFRKLESLELLNLDDNLISDASEGVFLQLKKLRYLSLANNKFEEIWPGYFEPLEDLEVLDLSRNLIKVIQKHSFDRLRKLKFLYLHKNPIVKYSEEDDGNIRFESLKSFLFTHLPGDCSVSIDDDISISVARLRQMLDTSEMTRELEQLELEDKLSKDQKAMHARAEREIMENQEIRIPNEDQGLGEKAREMGESREELEDGNVLSPPRQASSSLSVDTKVRTDNVEVRSEFSNPIDARNDPGSNSKVKFHPVPAGKAAEEEMREKCDDSRNPSPGCNAEEQRTNFSNYIRDLMIQNEGGHVRSSSDHSRRSSLRSKLSKNIEVERGKNGKSHQGKRVDVAEIGEQDTVANALGRTSKHRHERKHDTVYLREEGNIEDMNSGEEDERNTEDLVHDMVNPKDWNSESLAGGGNKGKAMQTNRLRGGKKEWMPRIQGPLSPALTQPPPDNPHEALPDWINLIDSDPDAPKVPCALEDLQNRTRLDELVLDAKKEEDKVRARREELEKIRDKTPRIFYQSQGNKSFLGNATMKVDLDYDKWNKIEGVEDTVSSEPESAASNPRCSEDFKHEKDKAGPSNAAIGSNEPRDSFFEIAEEGWEDCSVRATKLENYLIERRTLSPKHTQDENHSWIPTPPPSSQDEVIPSDLWECRLCGRRNNHTLSRCLDCTWNRGVSREIQDNLAKSKDLVWDTKRDGKLLQQVRDVKMQLEKMSLPPTSKAEARQRGGTLVQISCELDTLEQKIFRIWPKQPVN